MSIPGFASAQAAYGAAEPDNTDACEGCEDENCESIEAPCCGSCPHADYEEDPDDARDRAYAYDDED